jgi:hypothetical protein
VSNLSSEAQPELVGEEGEMKKPPAGRTPKATNWSSFFDGHLSGRDPGQWPSLLQEAWAPRAGQPTQPLPLGPDNMQSRGARASQYTS